MNRLSLSKTRASEPGYLLQVKDLSVLYRGQHKDVMAAHNVSLSLGQGETLGIIGESGSGKTSLALALLGLIKEPHGVSGEVYIGGENILALSEEMRKHLRWRKIALVFQNSLEVLNPVLKVGEQVSEPMKRHLKLNGVSLEREMEKLLALVGLEPHWQEAYPHQLSGGMRQRVLLAMALSCRPDLLLVDEPTTSLDAVSRKGVVEMLKSLQEELGFGLIVITHDLATVSSLTKRLIVLYNGEVMESGKTADVIEKPRHPYTRGLLNASVEMFPYKDLWGIPGEPSVGSGLPGCSFSPRCTQALAVCRETKPSLTELQERAVRCHRGGIVTLLQAKDITKIYALKQKMISALGGVGLEVYSGETLALVGASGSGKSTLAQILAGYLKSDSGEVTFRGQVVKDGRVARQENGIQLVLQDPFGSLSHRLTVEEAVAEPLLINRIASPEGRKNRVIEALRSVQLPAEESFLKRFCFMLSGGQRQRLAIARALVMRPALLLADEITSMLDVSTQANLMRLLKGLQNSCGFAMLYITHDLHLARKVAERIIVLHHGLIVEEGSAKRVTEYSCCRHTRELLDAGLEQR
ncbi:MAG: ABC transporter ATP-binding protein [Clostridiales bacterium]|jgi:peptide/nickel transport system ATP-binding protein|nr:ABC transporter ATP-binding protein [Clostridiales bacterium]